MVQHFLFLYLTSRNFMDPIMTEFQIDQLKEIVNIGAGNAATAISQMLGKKIKMSVPEALVDRVEKIPPFAGDSKEVMTVILLKLTGDVSGMMMLMFCPSMALEIASLMTGNHEKKVPILDELDRSALCEMGNIVAGASLSAFGRFLDLNITQSIPDTATDMLGSTLDAVLLDMGQTTEIMLALKVKIKIEEEKIAEGRLFFMFCPEATTALLEAAKKKFPTM